MTNANVQHPSVPVQDASDASAVVPARGKAAWEQPKLTRMDISLTQAAFSGSPDSDTSS
jgi:hypothetical protein